jgi:DNA polymerase-3 subunit alpha
MRVFRFVRAQKGRAVAVYESAMDAIASERRRNVQGQMSLFEMDGAPQAIPDTVPNVPELPIKMLLANEKEATGI